MEKQLKKYYRSFLLGKEHFTNDDKKTACNYFNQSLLILDELKKNNKYDDLVKETESECKQYLTKSINCVSIVKKKVEVTVGFEPAKRPSAN